MDEFAFYRFCNVNKINGLFRDIEVNTVQLLLNAEGLYQKYNEWLNIIYQYIPHLRCYTTTFLKWGVIIYVICTSSTDVFNLNVIFTASLRQVVNIDKIKDIIDKSTMYDCI